MNKKNLIIILITICFLVNSFAYGQIMMIKSSSSNISIPEQAKEYASEKDLIEALCYEAKFKGGEGVAQIEALNDALKPGLEKVEQAGISINEYDLDAKASQARQKLENICLSSTVDQSIVSIDDYIAFVEAIKKELQGEFRNNLQNLEKDLQKKGEELKEKLEKEIGEEAERMAKQVEQDLTKQGEQEGAALKDQLEQLAAEFQSFMSQGEVTASQAQSKAQELANRVSTDPETKSFLSIKFQEILGQAVSLIDQAMSGSISPAEIQSMATQKVPGVVEEIRSFMIEKYKKQGKQEEARIRQELEEKAEEIAGEEKEKLQAIGDAFQGIEQEIESLYNQKIIEWQEYEQKFLEKKKEIISKAIDYHFDQAKQLIDAKKNEIDQAVAEGVAEEFGIKSYQELINELEQDKQQLTQEMLNSNLNSQTINNIQGKFQLKWNDYRKKMEVIELRAPKEIIDRIVKAFEQRQGVMKGNHRQVEKRMRGSLDVINNNLLTEGQEWHDKTLLNCRNNPNLINSPTKRQITQCVDCKTLNEFKEMIDFWTINKGVLEEAINQVSRISDLQKNPPSTIKQALEFRDNLVTSLTEIELKGQEFNQKLQLKYLKAKATDSNNWATCSSLVK